MRVFIHDPNDDSDHEFTSHSPSVAVERYVESIAAEGVGDGPFDVWARGSSDSEWSVYRCRVEAVTRYDVTVKGTGERRPVEAVADDE